VITSMMQKTQTANAISASPPSKNSTPSGYALDQWLAFAL